MMSAGPHNELLLCHIAWLPTELPIAITATMLQTHKHIFLPPELPYSPDNAQRQYKLRLLKHA